MGRIASQRNADGKIRALLPDGNMPGTPEVMARPFHGRRRDMCKPLFDLPHEARAAAPSRAHTPAN